MNLLDLYENREPYQQAIDKLEQRRIEDLEARMDDCARRGDVKGFDHESKHHGNGTDSDRRNLECDEPCLRGRLGP